MPLTAGRCIGRIGKAAQFRMTVSQKTDPSNDTSGAPGCGQIDWYQA